MRDPKQKPKNPRVGLKEARKLSDAALVNLFFDDRGSRHVTERVIQERMREDGYFDFNWWVWNTDRPIHKRPEDDHSKEIFKTIKGDALGPELRKILELFDFDKADLREPERCREFCSEEGNVYDLMEDELSPAQKRMLGLIRDRCRRQLRHRS